MRINRKELANIMKKYNLETEINEQFRRLKDLISLGCNDEGELPYNVEDYWEFVWTYLVGFAMGKENAELKAQINYQTHCIKTQHEAANEMSKQIAELESKVKQLRCCGNCSEPCWDFPIVRKSECLSNDYSLWEQIK